MAHINNATLYFHYVFNPKKEEVGRITAEPWYTAILTSPARKTHPLDSPTELQTATTWGGQELAFFLSSRNYSHFLKYLSISTKDHVKGPHRESRMHAKKVEVTHMVTWLLSLQVSILVTVRWGAWALPKAWDMSRGKDTTLKDLTTKKFLPFLFSQVRFYLLLF